MASQSNLFDVLEQTSRTFYLPIVRLPEGLRDTVAAAYLCMRALDEIEDHPTLETSAKVVLLRKVSLILQTQTTVDVHSLGDLGDTFSAYKPLLPEVTLRLADWASLAPLAIAPRIWDTAAAMADRMAQWAERGWEIHNRADLNGYTFSVAGTVGLLICDIWAWFDGTQIDRICALHFGRGLQAVNILRNRADDLLRNVDFFPTGWTREHMVDYARDNLHIAKAGIQYMPRNAFKYFVEIPLLLAEATLAALQRGEEKLSRSAVIQILQQVNQA
jgi:farnesyl-diphosphate farnesyltransferase